MREVVNLFLGKEAVGVKGKQRGCRCCHRAHGQLWRTAVGCCISSLWISTSQIMCDKLQLGRKGESHPRGVRGTGRGQGALEGHGVPAATQTALWGARSLLVLGMYRSY